MDAPSLLDEVAALRREGESVLKAAHRELLCAALSRHHGHQSRAARELGITPKKINDELRKFGLRPVDLAAP